MSLANLKRNTMDIASLTAAAQAASTPNKTKRESDDDRYWKPTVDKAGNGYAVIRFLPTVEGEDLPWARYWDHGFKGPTGKWYIEKSLTSIGQTDPVGETNSQLWNSGIESDKAIAKERKRRLHYVSNIMVVSDPSNPESEGKVFLYKFGKKIFDKIMDAMQPQYPDEAPVNPYDFWEGANFALKIRQVDGYRNYDKSEFQAVTSLFGGDETKLEATYNAVHPLSEFTDPKNYKSYDELKKKFYDVIGQKAPSTIADEVKADIPTAAAPAYATAEAASIAEDETPFDTTPVAKAATEEDDTLSYFAKLAQED